MHWMIVYTKAAPRMKSEAEQGRQKLESLEQGKAGGWCTLYLCKTAWFNQVVLFIQLTAGGHGGREEHPSGSVCFQPGDEEASWWILKNSLWDNNFLYLLPSQTWPLESGSCPGLAIQAEKLGERTGKWVVWVGRIKDRVESLVLSWEGAWLEGDDPRPRCLREQGRFRGLHGPQRLQLRESWDWK